jgi:SAM-dependent methyltransferase
MPLLCPDCRLPLDPARLACANGHAFGHDANGVLVLLAADFAPRLAAFETRLQAIRAAEGRRLLDPALYPQLPFAPALRHEHEWRLRGHDWRLVARHLARHRRLRTLDIGAWNGWLSHRLAGLGHDAIAIDYFADPYDGLGARRWYSTAWAAIQMNLNDLAILPAGFDLIILNRCLQFQPDPPAFLAAAARLLAPGGLLLATGLQIFAEPEPKARQVAALLASHRRRYNFDLFLWPCKGYLDRADRARLSALGLAIRPYRALFAANLRARLRPALPWHGFGVMRGRPKSSASVLNLPTA